MTVKTKSLRTYALTAGLTNPSWIESNTPVGEVFDHLTQIYSLVYQGMAPAHPEFEDFSFDHIEMRIPESHKTKLTVAMVETKRLVDSYMIKSGFPCVMEFSGGGVKE